MLLLTIVAVLHRICVEVDLLDREVLFLSAGLVVVVVRAVAVGSVIVRGRRSNGLLKPELFERRLALSELFPGVGVARRDLDDQAKVRKALAQLAHGHLGAAAAVVRLDERCVGGDGRRRVGNSARILLKLEVGKGTAIRQAGRGWGMT